MRTQDEIVGRLRQERGGLLGFEFGVLLPCLDFDHAEEFREFLRDGVTRDEWVRLDEEAVKKHFADYAEFAWGKADNHRGLSAERSVAKLTAWTWLFGRDDVVEQVESAGYAQYGCPKLKVICEAFGFPIPEDESLQRMMRGEPCRPGCEDGCGS